MAKGGHKGCPYEYVVDLLLRAVTSLPSRVTASRPSPAYPYRYYVQAVVSLVLD